MLLAVQTPSARAAGADRIVPSESDGTTARDHAARAGIDAEQVRRVRLVRRPLHEHPHLPRVRGDTDRARASHRTGAARPRLDAHQHAGLPDRPDRSTPQRDELRREPDRRPVTLRELSARDHAARRGIQAEQR
jgi:hypothetical protein